MYKVKSQSTKHFGTVIGIGEYCVNNKWKKLKTSVGNSKEPLTDEMLTDFILQNKPDEINLIIKDKQGTIHRVDFPIEDLDN